MVTRTARAIADGEIADLSDWDDDERMYGRAVIAMGQLRGKPPKLIPVRILQEYSRRPGSGPADRRATPIAHQLRPTMSWRR
jgi:hypothetical protein